METAKIRIGKDFTVLWKIHKRENGVKVPYMLTAGKEDYTLRLWTPYGKQEVKRFEINENTIQFDFLGKDQKHLGNYSLELVERKNAIGMVTVDTVGFTLVAFSRYEKDGDNGEIIIQDVKLDSELGLAPMVSLTIDTELSETSHNAVSNYVITTKFVELGNKVAGLQDSINQVNESKVDKEEGKGLSSNDYTDEEKEKLESVEKGAQKNGYGLLSPETYNLDHIKADGTWEYVCPANDAPQYVTTSIQPGEVHQMMFGDEFSVYGSYFKKEQSGIYIKTSDAQIRKQSITVGFGISTLSDAYIPDSIARTADVDTAINTKAEEIYSVTSEALTGLDNSINQKLAAKVDKVSGKQLSTEDFTTALKQKLQGLNNYDDSALTAAIDSLQNQINTLVSGNASSAIDTFNEIVAFLDGVKNTQDLAGIIASIEQQIASVNRSLSSSITDLQNKDKQIDSKLSELSEGIDSVSDTIGGEQSTQVVTEDVAYEQNIGYIATYNQIVPLTVGYSRYSQPFLLKKGETLNIYGITANNAGRLASYNIETGAVSVILKGESENTSSADAAYETHYVAEEDMYVIVGWSWDYVRLRLSKTSSKLVLSNSKVDKIQDVDALLQLDNTPKYETKEIALVTTTGYYFGAERVGRASSIRENTVFSISDGFLLKKGESVKIEVNAPSTISFFVYKDGKDYRVVASGVDANQIFEYTSDHDAEYFVSFMTSNGIKVTKTSKIANSTSERLDDIERKINQFNQHDLAKIESALFVNAEDDFSSGVVEGKYVSKKGIVSNNDSFYYKEFKVQAATKIHAVLNSHPNLAAIAKKKSDSTYEVLLPMTQYVVAAYDYVMQEDAIIAISAYNDAKNLVTFETQNIESNKKNIENILSTPNTFEQDSIIQDIEFGFMFNNIAVIGDSLASGRVEGIQGQTDAAGKDFFDFSWLTMLAKRWRCKSHKHYSNAGATTKSWINDWLPQFKEDSQIYDLYFIALGTNNEYNESNYDDTKRLEFVARYNQIIDEVRTKAPHAAIMLLSLYEDRLGNRTLEEIAAERMSTDTGIYYLDYAKYAKYFRYSPEVNWRGHFSTTGYVYAASAINQILNKVIWENQNEEFWHQFAKYHSEY